MLSFWFKVLVVITVGFQFAASNFDEFVENEDPLNEDIIDNLNTTNQDLTAAGNINHTGIFQGIHSEISASFGKFKKNVGNMLPNILPYSESITARLPSFLNDNTSLHGTHEQLTSTAKDVLVPKGIIGSKEVRLWDPKADPTIEHGNMEWLGRELVKKVVNVFQKPETQGLDTNTTFFSGVVNKFKAYVQFVYPGTLWCGEGDVAGKSTQLGRFAEADKCCRNHDQCHKYIEKGQKKYGLENTGMFTRSHCSCDGDFLKCLKISESAVAYQIGFTYFTVLGPQCFEKKKEIEGCDTTVKSRCIKYNFKKKKEKKYQWFDNPTF